MRGPWRQAPAIIAQSLDPDVWSYLEGGGRVLYVVGPGAVGADLAGLRFFALPAAESWRMAAGAAWARPSRLAPAPVAPDLGWEVESIFPHLVIDRESIQPQDEVLAGWLEGWIANIGALALSRRVGAGRLIATTFRFEDPYGLDPVATLLLNRLLALLAE
jgi:hypothetical protein